MTNKQADKIIQDAKKMKCHICGHIGLNPIDYSCIQCEREFHDNWINSPG